MPSSPAYITYPRSVLRSAVSAFAEQNRPDLTFVLPELPAWKGSQSVRQVLRHGFAASFQRYSPRQTPLSGNPFFLRKKMRSDRILLSLMPLRPREMIILSFLPQRHKSFARSSAFSRISRTKNSSFSITYPITLRVSLSFQQFLFCALRQVPSEATG